MLRRSAGLVRRLLAGALASAAFLSGCGTVPAAFGLGNNGQTLTADAARKKLALDDWHDQIIYFILTDRFFDGDRTNDQNVDPNNPQAYHGGDLAGVIQKLDYIKNLGATTLWLTPIQQNRPTAFVNNSWGFHGYWIWDFSQVDPHLGTEQTYDQLVQAAHQRGMKVMMDMVCNHTSYDAPMATNPQYTAWFHHNGNITNWNDQNQLENFDVDGLPDFNTQNPDVQKYLINTWSGWIQRTGIDGMRMDTVKHVDMPFWNTFNTAINAKAPAGFLKLGEVLNGDPDYDAPYLNQGKFDSLFDYPMYYTINSVFAQGGSMRQLGQRFAQDGTYPDASLLAPFLDNHDNPRFLTSAGGDESKLRLALAFLLTMRGIPTLYMGDECGMMGANDPDNRKDMAWGQDPQLTSYTSTLCHLRQQLTSLRRGSQLEMWQDDQVYAYSRLTSSDEAIVVLNNATNAQIRTIPLRAESRLADGSVLANRLGTDTVTVANHQIQLTLQPKEAKILVISSTSGIKRPAPKRSTRKD